LAATPETSHKLKADRISKMQALRRLPKSLADAHKVGDIHIHDLDYFLTRPFCRSHDIRYIFRYGFIPDGTGTGASAAGPAQHAEVAVLQSVKVLSMAQTCYAGGQGLLHYLTFLSPYLEGKSFKEIKQLMQMLVYELNQTYISRGGQPVFSSVNLTPGVPEIFRDAPVVYRGQVTTRTYGEFEREVRLAFKALLVVMNKGDHYGRPFPFPKLEICLQKEFMGEEWDEPLDEVVPSYKELYQRAFDLAAKTGQPYFDNLLPSYRKSDGTVACYQCCSYAFQDGSEGQEFEDKLQFKAHFDLGAFQVVSLNLPRCAYKAGHNHEKLWDELRKVVEQAMLVFLEKKTALDKVRHRLQFALQTPMDLLSETIALPYTNFEDQVFEVGVVGLADMVEYHLGKKTIDSQEAREFAMEVLNNISMMVKGQAHKSNIKAAVARTPAETTGQRFAVLDLLHGYPDTVVHGDLDVAKAKLDESADLPIYYSNGISPWVGEDSSIYARIEAENDLWPVLDGGSLFHIFLGEKGPDGKALMEFALNLARKTNIGYFSFTKDMTICSDCKRQEEGLQEECRCGSKNVEQYSRITGYLAPVSRYNAGKRQELVDRKRHALGPRKLESDRNMQGASSGLQIGEEVAKIG
ncbi:MAG: anaerobic ribonucleoside-triphosphate reductase, partial [Chlorobium sp.]